MILFAVLLLLWFPNTGGYALPPRQSSASPPPPLVVSSVADDDDDDEFRFSLGVRDSLIVAHSFHGRPAGGLHGAITCYICDVDFLSNRSDPESNWVVIDAHEASNILSRVLSKYNHGKCDIDDDEIFPNNSKTVVATIKFLCRQINDDMRELMELEFIDFQGIVRIKLWQESHKARAAYTGQYYWSLNDGIDDDDYNNDGTDATYDDDDDTSSML